MKIECNVGGTERIVRLVLGIIFVAGSFYFLLPGAAQIIGYAIGVIALLTAITRYCPLNSAMGRNSCVIKKPT